jgi:hypothetical protein
MKWQKAPEELVTLLDNCMHGIPAERRTMFGYPCYFINKNMFIGLFQDQLFLRLAEEQIARLNDLAGPIIPLEPMPGRPMKNYSVIPPDIYRNSDDFIAIIQEAAEYARELKPKEKKPKVKK